MNRARELRETDVQISKEDFYGSCQIAMMGSSLIDISDLNSQKTKQRITKAPDGGYGWVIVFAAFINLSIVGAHMVGFSLFYSPIIQHFDSSYATVGLIGSVSHAMSFIPGFIYGTIVMKKGSRFTSMLGALLAGCGMILSSFAPNVYYLYVTYGCVSGCGIGLMNISSVVIVQQYFDKKRGKATGLALSGYSSGTFFGSALVYFCTENFGWRGALFFIGAVYFNGMVFGALQRPLEPNKQPAKGDSNTTGDKFKTNTTDTFSSKQYPIKSEMDYMEVKTELLEKNGCTEKSESKQKQHKSWVKELCDFSLLANPVFLTFCTATFLMNIGLVCFNMHAPSRALQYGMEPSQIAMLPPAQGISCLISRISFGVLSDMKWAERKVFYSVGIMLSGLAEMVLIFATTFPTTFLNFMLFGVTTGIWASVQTPVLVDLLSIERIAKSQALMGFFIGLGLLISTPFAGFLYDQTQNYNIPFIFGGLIQVLAAAMLFTMFIFSHFLKDKK